MIIVLVTFIINKRENDLNISTKLMYGIVYDIPWEMVQWALYYLYIVIGTGQSLTETEENINISHSNVLYCFHGDMATPCGETLNITSFKKNSCVWGILVK